MKWRQFSRRCPGQPVLRVFLVWTICWYVVWIMATLLYGLRLRGRQNIPERGALIYASNHQSHYDPPLVGALVNDRPFASMARASLFKFKPFGAFLRLFSAIPMERGRGDTGALKVAIAELKAGRCVLVFPEGTRSRDGALGTFKAGVVLLQKRTKATIVPVALEGLHDVWPCGASLPRLSGRIAVSAGEPITYEQLQREGAGAVMEKLKRRIDTMRMRLRSDIRHATSGRLPRRGPGDAPFWERAAEEPES